MAQAFSSFDTYLAPFVKVDNLTYKEVKQCLQSFVFGVNTPSRWGCVDTDTEVLSVNGFKKYNELKEGDLIYTWNNGNLELNPVRKVVTKPFKGQLHSYQGRNYNQTVTPNHRTLIKKFNLDEYEIKLSEEIFNNKTPYAMPVAFKSSSLYSDLTDAQIQLAAFVYTDGSIDWRGDNVHKVKIYKSPKRKGNEKLVSVIEELGLTYSLSTKNGTFGTVNEYTFYGDSARYIVELVGQKEKIHPRFFTMSQDQANLFLNSWALFDGDEDKYLCQYDNDIIRDQLQQIAVLACKCSYTKHRKLRSGGVSNYVKIRNTESIYPTKRITVDYDGLVWCPNVENGTAVFRKGDCVFISGQSQAPFTNVTIDWTVPNDLAELPAIVGGKEQEFKYKDCKKEMDMINKAFIEIMIEGDANGRGFQYPIPSYSITKDFDWSETENNKLLFEMTAKYGTPYFSNYINSDMEPSDVRSMCPLTPETLVTVRSKENGIRVDTINNIYSTYKRFHTPYDVWTGKEWCSGHPIQVPKTDVYEITFSNGYSVRMGANHLQPTKDFGTLHADELKEGMWLPFSKNQYGSDLGNYSLGYSIGAYVGDGSHDGNTIIYSLDAREKDDETEQNLVTFWKSIGFNAKVKFDGSVRFVRVLGNPYDIVNKYVFGDNALEKGLTNKTFNASIDFKNGLIDGLLATDGSRNRRRISTSSKILREHINILLSSMGMKCTQTFEDNRECRLGENTNYILGLPLRETYGDYYTEDDDYYYYSISKIEKCNYIGDFLYCFEVDNDDHLFALANGLITHNCRLRLDLRELRRKAGGYFGSGSNTGSVGVVTLNMPRLAYLSTSKEDFYKRLDKLMDIAARSLDIKRRVITQLLENDFYPYTKRYLGNFNNHFSTIGLVGMNEACLNAKWLQKDLTDKESQEFTKDVLNHMRERLSDYQEKYGDLFNLEATPAESTSYRFAKHDIEKYPNIITASQGSTPYYTNSSHLPVGFTDDIFEALDIQDDLQTLYTSGTVFHAFLGERVSDWKTASSLVRKIAENYKLPYFTLSPTYSVCKNHGYLIGEKGVCPICGEKTEVYSRITGYYRPVQDWNAGKAQEFAQRKEYDISHTPLNAPESSVLHEEKESIVDTPKAESEAQIVLIGTKTCPNCKAAKMLLTSRNIDFKMVYAEDDEDFVREYNITRAPTLLVIKDDVVDRYNNLSEIHRYLNT